MSSPPDNSPEDVQVFARDYFLAWAKQNPTLSLGIGAIVTLDHCLQHTPLTSAIQLLRDTLPNISGVLKACFPGSMSVANATAIFTSVVSRVDFEGDGDFTSKIRSNSEKMVVSVMNSHFTIHKWVNSFLRDGQIILIHSYSHIVASALLFAARHGKRFRVIITESRPECEGYLLATKLKEVGIPITLIVDSMVAHILATCDLILVGAEAVVENGGIINKIGTYQLGIIAKALNKPMYVLAESFKFQRQFIFHQQEIENNTTTTAPPPLLIPLIEGTHSPEACSQPHTQQQHHVPLVLKDAISAQFVDNDEYLDHKWDYTPPDYITLLFSDLGILSPSAVSDELFKLHY